MSEEHTIHDVARLAEVSIATVSRALSGHPSVRPATARRVNAAAEELGYRPNMLARGLRSNTTATVGMVVPAIGNPYYANLVEAVVRALQIEQREVLLADALDDPARERDRIRALLGRRVDSLIIVPCDRRRSADAVAEACAAVPIVQLDRYVDAVEADSVTCDDDAGIRAVIAHLGSAVDEHTQFISAKQSSSTAQRRLKAFRTAVEGKVPRSNELLGEFTAVWGRKAADTLFAQGQRPSTIVCGADVIALGVLQSLHQHGVSVPSQVRVTSYDDIPQAAMANPTLTSVRQPLDQLAETCLTCLDERASGARTKVRRLTLEPELIVRESSLATGPLDPPTA